MTVLEQLAAVFCDAALEHENACAACREAKNAHAHALDRARRALDAREKAERALLDYIVPPVADEETR